MLSRSSNPNVSLDLTATSFWNRPSKVSVWLFWTKSDAARGIMAVNNRTRAGTLPLDTHGEGSSIGGMSDL